MKLQPGTNAQDLPESDPGNHIDLKFCGLHSKGLDQHLCLASCLTLGSLFMKSAMKQAVKGVDVLPKPALWP